MTCKAKLGRTRMARRESNEEHQHHDRSETPNEIASNMIIPCPHCGSLSVYNERFNCCENGKVNLETYPFPRQLENLLPCTLKEVKTPVKTFADIIQIFHFASFSANPHVWLRHRCTRRQSLSCK